MKKEIIMGIAVILCLLLMRRDTENSGKTEENKQEKE